MQEWENPQITGVNKEPVHAMTVPFIDKDQACKGEYENSPYYHSLNGCWKFYFSPSVKEVPVDFYQMDFNTEHWDEVSVPGNWQMQGFDTPIYLNIRYPFQPDSKALHPPHIPHEINPVGLYRTEFTIPPGWDGRQVFIHFAGVESAFYIYLNGNLIGYSQNSMSPAEFNLTIIFIGGCEKGR